MYRSFRRHSTALPTILALVAGGSMVTCPAAAQDATVQNQAAPSQPIIPPIRYSLPPGEGSQPVSTPTPAPVTVAPPSVTVPPPRAAPTPRPTPTPTPTPRSTPTPRPIPTSAPAPVEAAPVSEPAIAPARPAPPPRVQPLEVAPTTTPIAPPVETAPPAAPQEDTDWTWLLLAGGIGLILIAGAVVWRRKAASGLAPETVKQEQPVLAPTPPVRRPLASQPLVAPPPPPVADTPQFLAPMAAKPTIASDGTIKAFQGRSAAPPPPPADPGYVTAFRNPAVPAPDLSIELNPIRAGCTEDAGFLEYSFAVINPSDTMVGDVLVSAWLVSANPRQDAQLREYLAEPADPSKHNLFVLKPGEHRVLEAAMGLPLDQLNIVEAAGRRFFAPMLLIDARYRTETGARGRTSAAFMVGRPQAANGKLSPVFVDRGARTVDGLATRPYPIPA